MKPKRPEVIGKFYDILETLGTGRWGEVFKARDRRSDKVLAVKVVRNDPGAEESILRHEFQILSRLDHPNIVKVYDLGTDGNGTTFYTMEWVDGAAIRTHFDDLRRDTRNSMNLLLQICSALSFIHSRNISHSDLKPENILIRKSGNSYIAKISDFGLAELFGKTVESGVPRLKGTYPYMSPELIRGQVPDHRSDLYSLGVILYEWTTGRNPFASESIQAIISGHLNKVPPPPKSVNPEIDAGLNSLILQLLAKEPSFRPSTAAEIPVILNIASRETIDPPPVTTGMFVNQQLAYRELQELFEKTCSGIGSLAVVSGPEGIGKSRLLSDVRIEFQLSGANIIDISPLSADQGAIDVFDRLFAELRQHNAKISPKLGDLIFSRGVEDKLYEGSDRERLKHSHRQAAQAFLGAFVDSQNSLSETPVVILFRDFHFSEQIPWQFFMELAFYWEQTRPEDVSCLWIVEIRSNLLESMLPAPVHGRMRLIEPVSLSEEDTGILLSSLLSVTPFPADLTRTIQNISGGNPRLINVIARTLNQNNVIEWRDMAWRINTERLTEIELTSDIRKMLKTQISQLPLQLRLIASHASLWQSGFTVEDLELTLSGEADIYQSLHQLLHRGILEKVTPDEGGGTFYRFRHGTLKDMIHESIPAYERTQHHLKIAEHLRELKGVEPEQVAHHYLEGDNRLEGCEWAADAAHRFSSQSKHRQAAEWFRTAIERMPDRNRSKIAQLSYNLAQNLFSLQDYRGTLAALEEAEPILDSRFYQKREKAKYLILLGMTLKRMNNNEAAAGTFEEAMEFLPKTTAMEIRLQLLAYYCFTLNSIGKPEKVIRIATDMLNDLPLDEYPYYAGLFLTSLSKAYYRLKDFDNAEQAIRRAIEYGESLGNPLTVVPRHTFLGQIFHTQNRLQEAIREYEKVISLTRKGSDLGNLGMTLCLYAGIKMNLEPRSDVMPLLQEALEIGERIGNPHLISHSLLVQSTYYINQGKLGEAENLLNKSRTYLDKFSDYSLESNIYTNLALTNIRRGNWSGALKYYDQLLVIARREKALEHIYVNYMAMANAFKYMENWSRALKYVDRCQKIAVHLNRHDPDLDTLKSEILIGMEDVRGALASVKSALDQARKRQFPQSQGYALYVLGRIYHKQGHFEKARDHLQSALKILESFQNVYEVGIVRYLLGELYQTTADKEKSKTELMQAKDCFMHLGAEFYLERVEKALELWERSERGDESGQDSMLLTFEQLTELLSSISNPDDLLEKILDVAIRHVNADRGMIILINEESGDLKIRAVRNLDESTSKDAGIISRTVLKEFAKSDDALMTGYAPSDPRFSTVKSVRAYNILSLICVPMRSMDRSIGVIYVDSRRTSNLFSEQDKRFLLAFANLAAVAIEKANYCRTQETERDLLLQEIHEKYRFDNLIGKSKIMQEVFQRLETISRTDTAVLITGASGTGKELAARSIHYNSHRKNEKFIVVNCAALPETLVESELFGYRKGAFTDAQQDKPGRFELADGGTLFLDEIAEMPVSAQAKLLRAIDNKEIVRLGDAEPRNIDVRIIAATNRDLRAEIQAGTFREDIYYRLRVASIRMPEMKERPEDIPFLVRHFMEQAGTRMKRFFTGIDPKALKALIEYDWPGNVRELEHAIESAVVFGTPPEILLKDLPQEIRVPFAKSGGTYDQPTLRSLDEVEEAHIRAILAATGGNKLKTCQVLEISRPTLDRKLEKYDIHVRKSKTGAT